MWPKSSNRKPRTIFLKWEKRSVTGWMTQDMPYVKLSSPEQLLRKSNNDQNAKGQKYQVLQNKQINQ